MFPELTLYPIQSVINAYVNLSPSSKDKLAAIDGKSLKVNIEPIQLALYILIKDAQIELSFEAKDKTSASISGTPIDLMQLIIQPSSRQRLFSKEKIKIQGDINFIQQFQDIIYQLDIDWEDKLSAFIGDVPAHFIGEACRQTSEKTQSFNQAMSDNLSDYLQEELRLFPTQEEAHDFFNDIHEIRLDVDRLLAHWQTITLEKNSDETN